MSVLKAHPPSSHDIIYIYLHVSDQSMNNKILENIDYTCFMPRSHIHGSPRRFHYGSNLTDDPGNAIFRRPIRMPNGVATGFDVSTKDKIW